jgi:hypothetical protein
MLRCGAVWCGAHRVAAEERLCRTVEYRTEWAARRLSARATHLSHLSTNARTCSISGHLI